MKIFSSVVLGVLALVCSATGFAVGVERFVEGVHYDRAEHGQAAPGTVVEFFSYGCPHCAHLEPELEKWLKTKPEAVKFSRVPATWNARFELLARVHYGLAAIGMDGKLAQPLFDYIHKDQRPLANLDDAAGFVKANGGDSAKFLAAAKSDAVNGQLEKAGELFARYRLSGVPALLVNGLYVTSVRQAGSADELFEIVNFLLTK